MATTINGILTLCVTLLLLSKADIVVLAFHTDMPPILTGFGVMRTKARTMISSSCFHGLTQNIVTYRENEICSSLQLKTMRKIVHTSLSALPMNTNASMESKSDLKIPAAPSITSTIGDSSKNSGTPRLDEKEEKATIKVVDDTRKNKNESIDLVISTALTQNSSIRNGSGGIILFDGICNFCNTWVDILLRLDVKNRYKYTPLQSEIGQRLLGIIGKDADDISSVVLVTAVAASAAANDQIILDDRRNTHQSVIYSSSKNMNPTKNSETINEIETKMMEITHYEKSACVLKVIEQLEGPIAVIFTRAIQQILPRNVRDGIYDMVANNRYKLLGRRTECRCSDPKYSNRFLSL